MVGTNVHRDVQSVGPGQDGGFVVDDAFLEPDALGTDGDRGFDGLSCVPGVPKDVYQIDFDALGDLLDARHDGAAVNTVVGRGTASKIRIDGNHLVSAVDPEGRDLVGIPVGLVGSSQDGDGFRFGEDPPGHRVRIAKDGEGRSHGMSIR